MDKQTILISGANSFIGSKLAQSLLQDGNNLILHIHKNRHNLHSLIEDNAMVKYVECDLSDWAAAERAFSAVVSDPSWTPHAMIHCAAIRSSDSLPLIDTDPRLWAEILRINTLSAYHILKLVVPGMKQNGYGRILLFGSDVTRSGLHSGSAYAAAKAAISNLVKTLALELNNSGILINMLSPGPVETSGVDFETSYRRFREEYFEEQLKRIPLQRVATVEDLYPICRFLISPDNTYLTGEEIYFTGGKS